MIPGRRWSREDDERLLRFRAAGVPWPVIANTMNRTQVAVEIRAATLLREGARASLGAVASNPMRSNDWRSSPAELYCSLCIGPNRAIGGATLPNLYLGLAFGCLIFLIALGCLLVFL
jgi:hypothetical protein